MKPTRKFRENEAEHISCWCVPRPALALDPAAATSIPPACCCLWDSACISGRSLLKRGVAGYRQCINTSPQQPLALASPNTVRFLGRGNPPFTAQKLVLAEPHTCHAVTRPSFVHADTSIDKCFLAARPATKRRTSECSGRGDEEGTDPRVNATCQIVRHAHGLALRIPLERACDAVGRRLIRQFCLFT